MRERFSRRDFLKYGVLLGAGLVLGSEGFVSGVRIDVTSTLEDADPELEREVEEKYTVDLVTMQEHYDFLGVPFSDAEAYYPSHWSERQLLLTDFALENLPAHMYESSGAGDPLRILLTKNRGTCCGEFELHGYDYAIAIGEDFVLDGQSDWMSTLAHELTHLRMPISEVPEDRRDEVLLDDSGLAKWSPWYDEIEKIVENKYFDFCLPLWDQVSEKIKGIEDKYGFRIGPNQYKLLDEQDRLQRGFYDRFQYGLAGMYGNFVPLEFVAVLAENYLHGEKQFVTWYSEFVPEEMAGKLHSFTREAIFKGYTYDKYPQIPDYGRVPEL